MQKKPGTTWGLYGPKTRASAIAQEYRCCAVLGLARSSYYHGVSQEMTERCERR